MGARLTRGTCADRTDAVLRAVTIALLLCVAVPAHALADVFTVFSQRPVGIDVYWRPAPVAGKRPAIIALHGCGGLFRNGGRSDDRTFDARHAEYTQLFHQQGWHVLLPDSFTARGERSICAVPNSARGIQIEDRRADTLAALNWLAARDDVDAARIAIVGWSHGAMTALSAINAGRSLYAQPVAGAAVFYPGCSELLAWPFKVATPVLMLLGEKDDWTRPAPCVALADVARKNDPQAQVSVITYADSHHGFDSARPVRFRADGANGVSKKGAHAGGNPAAREASRQALIHFLTEVLQ